MPTVQINVDEMTFNLSCANNVERGVAPGLAVFQLRDVDLQQVRAFVYKQQAGNPLAVQLILDQRDPNPAYQVTFPDLNAAV